MDKLELANVFLTSASILVAALGVARTEGLKSGISLLGIASGVLWILIYGFHAWRADIWSSPIALLPALFLVAWVISLVVHAPRYWTERSKKRHKESLEHEAKALKRLDELVDQLSDEEKRKIVRAHIVLRTALN